MITVIKGDIINSRKVSNPEVWLSPLKTLLNQCGRTPKDWEIVWGDSFQLMLKKPAESLRNTIAIKSLIKGINSKGNNKNKSLLDVRMSIGIGHEGYTAKRISESNGDAFIFAGENFENLKKEKNTLIIKTPWNDFDEEMNLYIKLINIIMDNWSISSAELVKTVLQFPNATQQEIGNILKIKQNSVSDRYKRARIEEISDVEKMFRKKLNKLLI